MTIIELAQQLDTTPRTIYRKITKAGLSMEKLRDAEGQLQTDAAQIIASMFDDVRHDKTRDKKMDRHANVSSNNETEEGELTQCHALEVELATAKGRIEALERENSLLRQMVEDAKARADEAAQGAEEWKKQAQMVQQQLLAQMQRLLPEKRESIFTRWLKRGGAEGK